MNPSPYSVYMCTGSGINGSHTERNTQLPIVIFTHRIVGLTICPPDLAMYFLARSLRLYT